MEGIKYSLLPEWYDVDDTEGLRRWKGGSGLNRGIDRVTVCALDSKFFRRYYQGLYKIPIKFLRSLQFCNK
jgi:hypothetical protein